MKFNLLILLMLLSIVGCKKDKQSSDGQWNLKTYSVSYFDLAGNKIFESKPDELLQFSKIQIANDSIGIFSEPASVTSQILIKTNPASLIYVSVQKSKNGVNVKFSTTNEVNVSHFKIESSADGINYTLLGSVKAFNSVSQHEYVFTDFSPNFGTNYYLIQLVDFDGKTEYSAISTIKVSQNLIKEGNGFYFPASLIDDTFKKVKVKFSGENKMIWKDEVGNTVYFENGIPKSAAKAKLQMEFDKN